MMHRCFHLPMGSKIPVTLHLAILRQALLVMAQSVSLSYHLTADGTFEGDNFELLYEEKMDEWIKIRVSPGKSRIISSNKLKWSYAHGGVPSKAFGYRFTVRPLRDLQSSVKLLLSERKKIGTKVKAGGDMGIWYPSHCNTSICDFDEKVEATRDLMNSKCKDLCFFGFYRMHVVNYF